MEFIRFALLLVITVAAISVATRIHDNGGSKEAGARSGPSATAAPTGGSSGAGGSSSGATSSPDGGTSSATGSSGSTGSSGGTGSTTSPVLPRTGTDDAVRLTALAFLLLGAGSFSISLSRR